MEVKLQGYNNKYMTMKISKGLNVGEPVDILQNNTAHTAKDGRVPIGKLVSQNGEYGLVQTTGAMEFMFTGEKINLGYGYISSDSKGGIKADKNGRGVIITEICEKEKTVTIVM